MNLEFLIEKQIIKRTDKNVIISKSKNLKCVFTFEDNEWDSLNKFAIFKDSWGNSKVIALDEENNGEEISCIIPNRVLEGTYFSLSVYAGDLITFNAIVIPLLRSSYQAEPPKPDCGDDQKNIFIQIWEALDAKVEDLEYSDDSLLVFKDGVLYKTISLPFVPEETILEWLSGKSDVGHTHSARDIAGLDSVSEVEIKKAFRILETDIRTYGE